MAEGLAIQAIRDRYPVTADLVPVSSAGVAALDGNPAVPEAVAAMRRVGIDITGHRARRLTSPIVAGSDCVLAMEEGQRRAITSLAPGVFEGRVFLLMKLGEAAERVLEGGTGTWPETGPEGALGCLSRAAAAFESGADWLREPQYYEVEDPFGYPLEEFERAARKMSSTIDPLLEALLGGKLPARGR